MKINIITIEVTLNGLSVEREYEIEDDDFLVRDWGADVTDMLETLQDLDAV